MRWSRLGIRFRIIGGSLLIAGLTSVVAGLLIFSQVQRIAADGQGAVLASVQAPYVTALNLEPTESFDPPGLNQLVAVVTPLGVAAVDTLPAGVLDAAGDLATPGQRTVVVDSSSFLVLVTGVSTPAGTWHVIAASANDAQQFVLDQVALLLIVSIAVINLAFGAGSWLIGSAVLGPVARLRRSAEDLVRSPGTELLPVGPAHDEIADLAGSLNMLIEQLRDSTARERDLISHASHEIRTPIAILQTQLELAQAEASTLAQLKAEVAAAQMTVARLAALATSMLDLSRIDAQTVPGSATLDELATELADAADRGRRHVGGRDIRIDFDCDFAVNDAATLAPISQSDFGRICDNLVSNALAAMGSQGTVQVRLASTAGELILSVTDSAGGIDETFLPHALDRFSQADRSRGGGGAGLGLAIVAGLADVAGGELRLINDPGRGLEVQVRLPQAGPPFDMGAGAT